MSVAYIRNQKEGGVCCAGHFYNTTKDKRTTPEKIEMKQYDSNTSKHVMYKETKLK